MSLWELARTNLRNEPKDALVSDLDRFTGLISEKKIALLRFELPDTHGIARSKIIPVQKAAQYCRSGVNMYGGTLGLDVQSDVVPGTGYGEEIHYADHFLFPDYETFCSVPWVPETGRVICDPRFADGTTCEAAPRVVLQRVLERYRQLGFEVKNAFEMEFYILDPATHQPVFDGKHIFSNLRNTCSPLVGKVLEFLPSMGIDVLTVNCEYAPAQIELTYAPQMGIHGSDAAYTIKNGIKEIAQSMGLLATFMSKPFANLAGCGCHYHCSLLDKEGKNAFSSESSRDGLSPACHYFVGGLLRHLPSVTPLLAPTLNCYKRYRPHTFAPINVSWGFEDRTAAIRIKAGKGDSAHIENRVPSGSSNPYLSAAGTLAAGLLGIVNKIEPTPLPQQMADSLTEAAPLPSHLADSLNCLASDREICGILGSEFIKLFTAVKQYELSKFNDAVTDFERREYMEFL